MKHRLESVLNAFEQLRRHVRPEGDAAAGNLAVAISQAVDALADLPAPIEPAAPATKPAAKKTARR